MLRTFHRSFALPDESARCAMTKSQPALVRSVCAIPARVWVALTDPELKLQEPEFDGLAGSVGFAEGQEELASHADTRPGHPLRC